MKNGDAIRNALVENTISLIGNGGFEKATTKAIVSLGIDDPSIKLNEVYIYRVFGSKELLYAEAFSVLDTELFTRVRNAVAQSFYIEGTFRDRMQSLFDKMWEFLIGNECRCRCYVRYYYSAYFREQTMRNHRKHLSTQKEFFATIFKEESDTVTLIHNTFMTMMDFAIRVFNGEIENDEENTYHIFNLLYYSLTPYFDPEVVATGNPRRRSN